MFLKTHLESSSKALLQGYYLYWRPRSSMLSAKDQLADHLMTTMTDPEVVRERFDSLGRSHRSFIVSLLVRDEYSGTLEDVRSCQHGRAIETFEVESIVRTLLDDGYLLKSEVRNGSGREEMYVIPNELGDALRRTVAIDSRSAFDMLSYVRSSGQELNGKGSNVANRIADLAPATLQDAAETALREEHGILTHAKFRDSFSDSGGMFPENWRDSLESAAIGTTGVLNLKEFGIQFEEDALMIFQELVYEDSLAESLRVGRSENDSEVFFGTDFVIDLERFLEILRTENIEVTREGKLYKKTEERIASRLITGQHSEIFETSSVQQLLDVARRLRFFDIEDSRLVPIPLRRRGWQKKNLFEKVKLVYEHSIHDHTGKHWSFHQKRLRQLFLEEIQSFHPGEWLGAHAFLTGVIARFLLTLEKSGIREEFQKRCEDDRHSSRDGIGETLMVSLAKLQHDLSYWLIHRTVLLGIVDAGYEDGVLRTIRLSDLGQRFFGLTEWKEEEEIGKPALVNPDFEVLVFPGVPLEDEANLAFSRFADRQDSERVRRYRLTKESVKRGVVCGMTGEEILGLLRRYSRNQIPENVEFSVGEWTDGVELVRRQKVLLLRSISTAGMDRLLGILDAQEIPYERLTDTAAAVRGTRNEKAIRDLRDEFRNEGLFIE